MHKSIDTVQQSDNKLSTRSSLGVVLFDMGVCDMKYLIVPHRCELYRNQTIPYVVKP